MVSSAMLQARFISRSLLPAAAILVAVTGLSQSWRTFGGLERGPRELWGTERFLRLRTASRGIPEFGYDTDLPATRTLGHRIATTQWAVAPAVLIHDFDQASILRRLRAGFAIVCDYADAKKLDARIALFQAWCEAEHLPHRVVPVTTTMAILVTHPERDR